MTLAVALAERGLIPLPLLRWGIRRLLRQRLAEQQSMGGASSFLRELRRGPIALQPDKPNEQHYEVPADFFQLVLGPRLKYSSAYWPSGTTSLAEAETRMLEVTCQRAEIEDGQDILELGCGWGSLSLYMARRYPASRIVAVSNSGPQRTYIASHGLANLNVITQDMNLFDTDRRFDRVVSVEMFEHMRNYALLMHRIAGWLNEQGKLFIHVFCHRQFTYPFETTGRDDWMGRYFFTGGLMPSLDLLPTLDDDFRLESQWEVNGSHYQRTAEAWRHNLENRRHEVLECLSRWRVDSARRWYHRWRLFFLACEELWGFRGGEEWLVAHYRFAPQVTGTPRRSRTADALSTSS